MRKTYRPSFSFESINDATEEFYHRMLSTDVEEFKTWVAAHPNMASKKLETQFRAFWNNWGRVNFKTTEDSLRYRRELFEAVVQSV